MLLNLQPHVYVLNVAYGSNGPFRPYFRRPHLFGPFWGGFLIALFADFRPFWLNTISTAERFSVNLVGRFSQN